MTLKEKKLDFQRGAEEYIEQKKLYEMFEEMMESLIVNRPEDPIKFLIDKMEKPNLMRIVLVGPPGSKRKEIALGLSAHYTELENGKEFTCISVGDLIARQIVQKNQQYCEDIEKSLQTYSYVKDEIVIKLVRQQIESLEKEGKSWIIEGFPRTEAQAIALQKMGIIPDKFIMVNQSESATLDRLDFNMKSDENKSKLVNCQDAAQRARLAKNALLEYQLNIQGVQKIAQGMITTLQANEKETLLVEEIVRIMKLKDTNAPRRPQRIILLGSPGSKKEQYAVRIAEKYKLIYVKVDQLITEVMRRNGDNDYARQLKAYIAKDRKIPDDVVIDLVQERLCKPDCRLNGWILDGCPFNLKQVELLQDMKIEPQKVIAFETSDDLVYQELSNVKIHEQSGKHFTAAEAAAAEESIRNQLVARSQVGIRDEVEEYRFFLETTEAEYSKFLIRIQAEGSEDKVWLNFCDAIESTL